MIAFSPTLATAFWIVMSTDDLESSASLGVAPARTAIGMTIAKASADA